MAGNPLVNMMGNNMMQNNPVFQMINMMKNGGNPQALVQQLIGKNPEFGNLVNSLNGKDQGQVNDMIAKMAKEKGVDLPQLAQNIGMPAEIQKKFGIG